MLPTPVPLKMLAGPKLAMLYRIIRPSAWQRPVFDIRHFDNHSYSDFYEIKTKKLLPQISKTFFLIHSELNETEFKSLVKMLIDF